MRIKLITNPLSHGTTPPRHHAGATRTGNEDQNVPQRPADDIRPYHQWRRPIRAAELLSITANAPRRLTVRTRLYRQRSSSLTRTQYDGETISVLLGRETSENLGLSNLMELLYDSNLCHWVSVCHNGRIAQLYPLQGGRPSSSSDAMSPAASSLAERSFTAQSMEAGWFLWR